MNILRLIPLLRELQESIRTLTQEVKALRTEIRRLDSSRRRPAGRSSTPAASRNGPGSRATGGRGLDVNNAPVSKPAQKAASYLQQQGFVVWKYHEHDADSADERSLSKFLGDHHETTLAPLYSLLRDVEVNKRFALDLTDSTAQEINDSVQLCQLLETVQYLHDFDYARNSRKLTGALTAEGDAYIRGRWLEQYVRRQLVSGFGRAQVGYSLIMNPHLASQDGSRFELDLFVMERDKPMWIECTTAKDPRDRLSRMRSLRNRLDLPANRTLLIVTGMSSQRIRGYARQHPLAIVNVSKFPALLGKNLEKSA